MPPRYAHPLRRRAGRGDDGEHLAATLTARHPSALPIGWPAPPPTPRHETTALLSYSLSISCMTEGVNPLATAVWRSSDDSAVQPALPLPPAPRHSPPGGG